MPTPNSIGIIIVTYGNEASLPELLDCLADEKQAGDTIVIIDNHPAHGCADIAYTSKTVDIVMCSENVGFGVACNKAALQLPAAIENILIINPDVTPLPGAVTELRTKPRPEWGAWMGLLLLPDRTVNSAGNILHMSGLAWCDAYGKPAAAFTERCEVDCLSGACLMIRKAAWQATGGFTEEYFMYYEDIDLSLKLRQQHVKLGLVPSAKFLHDYSFRKGSYKWYYLERNRGLIILLHWPLGVLLIFIPLFIVIEAGLWLGSLLQRRFWLKVRSSVSFLGQIPKTILLRRQFKQQNRFTNATFISLLKSDLSSPLLGIVGQSRLVNAFFRGYLIIAKAIIGVLSQMISYRAER